MSLLSNLNNRSSINCLCDSAMPLYEIYSLYHNNIINKFIHIITIPIIIVTTCHFLEKVDIVYKNDDEWFGTSINLLSIVQVFYCAYYFTWSWTIGFIMMFYFEGIQVLLHNIQRRLLKNINQHLYQILL